MSASPNLVTGDYISHAGETELDCKIFLLLLLTAYLKFDSYCT